MREIRHGNLFWGKRKDEEDSSVGEAMELDEGIWMGMEESDMPDALAAEVSKFNFTFAHLRRRVMEAAQNKKVSSKSAASTNGGSHTGSGQRKFGHVG